MNVNNHSLVWTLCSDFIQIPKWSKYIYIPALDEVCCRKRFSSESSLFRHHLSLLAPIQARLHWGNASLWRLLQRRSISCHPTVVHKRKWHESSRPIDCVCKPSQNLTLTRCKHEKPRSFPQFVCFNISIHHHSTLWHLAHVRVTLISLLCDYPFRISRTLNRRNSFKRISSVRSLLSVAEIQ